MASNQVTLTFAGDDKPLKRTLDDVGDRTDRMSRRVDDASDRMRHGKISAGEYGAALKQVASVALIAAAAIGTAAFAIGKESVEAFVEAQTQQAKLEDAYARFPKIANVSIETFRKLNTELMKKTRFDDDASAAAEAMLAQYKLTGKQIAALIPLVQDYAAKTGKDLPDAAQTLGNALLGKGRALAEIGIKFKDAGSVTKNYEQLMIGLRQQVGGFAEQEGKTAAGQLEILKNRFGEVEEALGSRLLPIVSSAVSAFADLAEAGGEKFDELVGTVDGLSLEHLPELQSSLRDVGNEIAGAVNDSLKDMKKWVKDNREEIDKFVGQLSDFIDETGPLIAFTIKTIAQQWMFWSSAIMAVVNALNKLKDWYNQNVQWLSPLGNLINKIAPGTQGAGQFKGGATQTMGTVPKMHSGGVVPGAPGSEMLAILQAGETVTPAGAGQGMTLTINSGGSRLDDMLTDMLKRAVRSGSGNIVTIAGGRGSR